VLMKLTGLENSFICQPQNVNLAGRVFGGFISNENHVVHIYMYVCMHACMYVHCLISEKTIFCSIYWVNVCINVCMYVYMFKTLLIKILHLCMYVVHRAYDLALATCYTFAGSYPVFQQVAWLAYSECTYYMYVCMYVCMYL
jgi:hypothetical protein